MTIKANDKSEAVASDNAKAVAKAIREGAALPVGRIYTTEPITIPAGYSSGRIVTKRGGGIANTVPTSIQMLGRGPVMHIGGGGLSQEGTLELIGHADYPAIEIEGEREPVISDLAFDRLVVQNAAVGIKLLDFPSQDHADNSTINSLAVYNVATAVESHNQQAVNWRIRELRVNAYAGGPDKQVVINCLRGGLIKIGDLICCHRNVQVIRVHEFSSNQCGFTIDHLQFDNFDGAAWLSLFEYAGPVYDPGFDQSYMKWRVRVHDGFVPPNPKIDLSQWINVPAALRAKGKRCIDLSGIQWDVSGVNKV